VGEIAVSVADLDAPQARHAVDQPVALRIPEVHAVRARDDAHTFAYEGRCVRKRMNMVRRVERLPMRSEIVRAVFLRHVSLSRLEGRNTARRHRADEKALLGIEPYSRAKNEQGA